MNRKFFTSLLIIGMVLAAMSGATLAWFTAQDTIEQNVFEAGTVIIEADEEGAYAGGTTNWNPGDEGEKDVTVKVTGTKKTYLRAQITEVWTGLTDDPDYENNYNNEDEPYSLRGISEGAYTIQRWAWLNDDPNKVEWYLGGDSDTGKPWPLDASEDPEWQYLDGWWYYTGEHATNGVIDTDEGIDPKNITFLSYVKLKGLETTNEYQGAGYTMDVTFQAIQSSHFAIEDAWTADVFSTYVFDYTVPTPTAGEDEVVPVTFKTDVLSIYGYNGVRFEFEASGPGDVTFKATDSGDTEHIFTNSGTWGPAGGFELPADYTAITNWTLNFAATGDYTITFRLVDVDTGTVIADGTQEVTVSD